MTFLFENMNSKLYVKGGNMEFHQLRTFYYVATYLNFSKAAEEVSQPAVSRQIKTLEKYYDR